MIETVEQAIRHVHERTGLPLESFNGSELPDTKGFWVWQPIRGGVKAAVAPDGSLLLAGSAANPDEVKKDFRWGRRSDPAKLDDFREYNLRVGFHVY